MLQQCPARLWQHGAVGVIRQPLGPGAGRDHRGIALVDALQSFADYRDQAAGFRIADKLQLEVQAKFTASYALENSNF